MNITCPEINDNGKWEVKLIHLPKNDVVDKHEFETKAEAQKFYHKAWEYQKAGAD